MIELYLIKGIEKKQDHRDHCVTMKISRNTVIPTTFKEISDNHGQLHPQ